MFTRYSTASCISLFFILRASQASISSLGVLPSGYGVLYYMLGAQLFLLLQLVLHRRHTVRIIQRLRPQRAVSLDVYHNRRNPSVSPLVTRATGYLVTGKHINRACRHWYP